MRAPWPWPWRKTRNARATWWEKTFFPPAEELLEDYNRLIAQARRRRLAPEDSTGGIATVTNFGGFGLTFAAPMPMPSESIILGVGAVTKTPVWSDEVEAFIPISKANIVATGDHRVVDGADIGRVLKRVAELLQRPEYL